jgi:hypothetical protein
MKVLLSLPPQSKRQISQPRIAPRMAPTIIATPGLWM